MEQSQQTYLEVIAPSLEEAISKGLSELSLPREAVDIQVLDKGRRGLLGVGSRQVRIRLFIKHIGTTSSAAEAKIIPSQEITLPEPISDEDDSEDSEDGDEILDIAEETIRSLLQKMSIKARVDVSYKDADLNSDINEKVVHVEISGEDLSILIGRQAETLHALQFISSLIINKQAARGVPLNVDVEHYRERRKRQLLQMARSMAEQAVQTGRRQILEPMSSEDRRTIHMELRNNPNVFTESMGEEPRRKVTIIPKN